MNTRTVKDVFDDFPEDIPDYVHIPIKEEPLAIEQEEEFASGLDVNIVAINEHNFLEKNMGVYHESPYRPNMNYKSKEESNTLEIPVYERLAIKAEPLNCVNEIEKPFSDSHENKLQLKSDAHDWSLGDPLALYKCDICLQPLYRAETLVAHRYCHTQDIEYTCLICYSTFHIKQDLHNHILTVHFNTVANACKICAVEYSSNNPPKIRKCIHTDNKVHACHICHSRFTRRSYLNSHIRNHSGIKRYECDLCLQRFMSKGTLGRHKRIHTGERPHKCDTCLKQFAQRATLAKHKRIHTGEKPFTCDICHKQFSLKFCLDSHTRIHTRDNPYKCDICRKYFTTHELLNKHKSIHNSDKYYQCDVCQKGYMTSKSLKRHKCTNSG